MLDLALECREREVPCQTNSRTRLTAEPKIDFLDVAYSLTNCRLIRWLDAHACHTHTVAKPQQQRFKKWIWHVSPTLRVIRYSVALHRTIFSQSPDTHWPQEPFCARDLAAKLREFRLDAADLSVARIDLALDYPISAHDLIWLRAYARRACQWRPIWPEHKQPDHRSTIYVGGRRSKNILALYDKAQEQLDRRGRDIQRPLTRVEIRLRPSCTLQELPAALGQPLKHADFRAAVKPKETDPPTYRYWHRFRRHREYFIQTYARMKSRYQKQKVREWHRTLPKPVSPGDDFNAGWPAACRCLLDGLHGAAESE